MKSTIPNLCIKTSKGRQYYVARVTIDGKRVDRSLGSCDVVTLQQAKLALRGFMDSLKTKEPEGTTFAKILPDALAAIGEIKKWKQERSRRQWEQTLHDYALPYLGPVPVDEITVDHILSMLQPIWAKKPETAARLRMRVEAVLNWATVKGLRTGPNPAVWRGNLQMLLPPKSKLVKNRHFEAPTLDELRTIVLYCVTHPSPGSGLLLVIIGSACRVTEARYMENREIEEDVWTIPAVRMKNSLPHRVPVTDMMATGLAMGNREWDGLIFSALPMDTRPLCIDIARQKIIKIIKRKVTAHGIRSTFRDWCASTGVPDAVAEKCLSHTWGDATVQAYFRTDLLERRREVMRRWAETLMPAPWEL